MIVILMAITKILLPVTITTTPMVWTVRMHNDTNNHTYTNVYVNNDTKNDTYNSTQTGLHRQEFKRDKHWSNCRHRVWFQLSTKLENHLLDLDCAVWMALTYKKIFSRRSGCIVVTSASTSLADCPHWMNTVLLYLILLLGKCHHAARPRSANSIQCEQKSCWLPSITQATHNWQACKVFFGG